MTGENQLYAGAFRSPLVTLLHFSMRLVLPALRAKPFNLQTVRVLLLVLGCRVIAILAVVAL